MTTQQPVAKKQPRNIVEFKKLKLNDTDYHVGDTVQIKEYYDDSAYGTIVKIWKDTNKPDAYVKLRWFYKPADVFHEDHDFISRAELFDSDNIQDIWVQSLYDKVTVLSFEDYHCLDEVDDDVFFSRAVYNYKDGTITPPISEWKKNCICKSIINPDTLYVACDNCWELFHPHCVGISPDDPGEWFCRNCKQ
ncbi:unnamed protein product [Blepharisma stoltei]|uniref:Uncharacterized protein n=1 Tax=Blepharisma stoltei TaxID=1481888 RepID=A0AAU9JKV0_9CILI|nr:unnamed protein product [Blepharisma stoltei]